MEEGQTKKMKEGCEDGSTRVNLWCELPQHMLELILRRIPLEDRGRFACVCRSWCAIEKQTPLSQLPWVMLKPKSRLKEKKRSFFNLADGQIHQIKLPGLSLQEECKASCRGWFLMGDDLSGVWSLLNPITRKEISVPRYNSYDCLLAPDPTTPNDIVIVTLQEKSIRFCQPRLDISKWRESRLVRQGDGRFLNFRGVITCRNKLYFLDYERNFTVLDIDNGESSFLRLESSKIPDGLVFPVEFCGDIILVLVAPCQDSCSIDEMGRLRETCLPRYDEAGRLLHWFEVFKADLDTMMWVKLRSLGNQMLFLSERSCFSVPATAGCKGNKIYYLPCISTSCLKFDHWIEFDLDEEISVACLLPNKKPGGLDTWKWLMPSLGR